MLGVARLWDLSGSLQGYRRDVSPAAEDYEALRSDWDAVGDDLRNAIAGFERGEGRN